MQTAMEIPSGGLIEVVLPGGAIVRFDAYGKVNQHAPCCRRDAYTVPVRVELHATRPSIDCAAFQHVVEAGFNAPSGRLVVAGLTGYWPEAARFAVPAGPLGALVTFQGLDTLDKCELESDDLYVVYLWTGEVQPGVRVPRAYPTRVEEAKS